MISIYRDNLCTRKLHNCASDWNSSGLHNINIALNWDNQIDLEVQVNSAVSYTCMMGDIFNRAFKKTPSHSSKIFFFHVSYGVKCNLFHFLTDLDTAKRVICYQFVHVCPGVTTYKPSGLVNKWGCS